MPGTFAGNISTKQIHSANYKFGYKEIKARYSSWRQHMKWSSALSQHTLWKRDASEGENRLGTCVPMRTL